MKIEHQIVEVRPENIGSEHICCGFADKKIVPGYQAKKMLMSERFAQGYRFRKFNVRGKAFVETVPGEYAWSPVTAPGYLLIHCFWVSGRFQGLGMGRELLVAAEQEAAGKSGLVVVSSSKKRPFLTDKKFFTALGFEVCDHAPPYFELLVKRFDHAPLPTFNASVRSGRIAQEKGAVFYYSNMCPFTEHWVGEMEQVAMAAGLETRRNKITSLEAAQKSPTPFPIFSVFVNGQFLAHEMMGRSRFEVVLGRFLNNGQPS